MVTKILCLFTKIIMMKNSYFFLVFLILINCSSRKDYKVRSFVGNQVIDTFYHENKIICVKKFQIPNSNFITINSFSEKGNLISSSNYLNEKLHGIQTLFYKSGNMKSQTEYIDGIKFGSSYHFFDMIGDTVIINEDNRDIVAVFGKVELYNLYVSDL